MHAIIETGGRHYRVAPGDVIRVEKITAGAGTEIELPVKATVLGEGRGDKIIVFKFKKKKQYKKTIGHRQSYSNVKVGDFQV